MIEIITKSAEETKKVGFNLVAALKREPALNRALIIALEGNLGSGKTTFIQGLAKGLDIKENVLSPTFVIQKDFPINLPAQGGPAQPKADQPWAGSGWRNFYHIDAYRLKNPQELLELGFKDLIKNPENLIIIEWADKVKKILPKDILKIKFLNLGKNKRRIIL